MVRHRFGGVVPWPTGQTQWDGEIEMSMDEKTGPVVLTAEQTLQAIHQVVGERILAYRRMLRRRAAGVVIVALLGGLLVGWAIGRTTGWPEAVCKPYGDGVVLSCAPSFDPNGGRLNSTSPEEDGSAGYITGLGWRSQWVYDPTSGRFYDSTEGE